MVIVEMETEKGKQLSVITRRKVKRKKKVGKPN